MTRTTLFALPAGLIVAAGLAMAVPTSSNQPSASNSPTTTKATMHHETGKVTSLAANQLVLDHWWKGKEEKTTFTLESATKKDGDIKEGDRVRVYYHYQNGHRIATELRALGTKSNTEPKKT